MNAQLIDYAKHTITSKDVSFARTNQTTAYLCGQQFNLEIVTVSKAAS